jgi:two-component system nitrate/nitrite response regulator NarL
MLATTASVLQSAGYSVVRVTATGAAALEAIEATQPDFAVIDYELPDMNGIELAERAVLVAPGTRLVLHSARIDPSSVGAALAAGMRGIVVKGSATRLLDAVLDVQQGEVYVDPTLGLHGACAGSGRGPDRRT